MPGKKVYCGAEPNLPTGKKVYCGAQPKLPSGYDDFGSILQCIDKGQIRRFGRKKVSGDIIEIDKKGKKGKKLRGGKLKAGLIKDFFVASHDPELTDVRDYKIDKSISNKFVKVYHNDKIDWTVVVHRGSADMKDAIVDAKLLVGRTKNERFKTSERVQMEAEEKYNPNRMSVLGSSLGGYLSQMYGSNAFEIITSGKPVTPKDIATGLKPHEHQYDIRTTTDPVSALKPLQPHKNDIILKSKTPLDPYKSHIGDEVMSERYFPADKMIGRGQIDKMKLSELREYIKRERRAKKLKIKDYPITKKNKGELRGMAYKLVDYK